jgi:hypothetical protein
MGNRRAACLGAVGSGTWYAGSSLLDRHLQAALKPVRDNFAQIIGDVGVLQAQIAAVKYSNAVPQELKAHRNEFVKIRGTLASATKNTPGFWPATFQIITLLSQAASEVEPTSQKESVFDNVSGPGIQLPEQGFRVLLKDRVAHLVFRNATVRFDPSVQLVAVTFINCVLIFPAIENPPQPLQQIGSELLAADLSHVTVSGGS